MGTPISDAPLRASLDGTEKLPTSWDDTKHHITTAGIKDYVLADVSFDAMIFEGVVDCSANPNYPAADRGSTYRVSVAGKIGGGSGVNVEVGDVLVCLTDGTVSGNHATVGASWTITQGNIDGAVIGPASTTDEYLAVFDGTSGKLIKGGGTTVAGLTASILSTIRDGVDTAWNTLAKLATGLTKRNVSVANYAALQTMLDAECLSNVAYSVLGAVTANDGGEGTFFYDSSDTTTADDGGLCIRQTAGTGRTGDRRFKRQWTKYRGYYSWFQVKADSGSTTDNAAKINTASALFAAAGAAKGVLPTGATATSFISITEKIVNKYSRFQIAGNGLSLWTDAGDAQNGTMLRAHATFSGSDRLVELSTEYSGSRSVRQAPGIWGVALHGGSVSGIKHCLVVDSVRAPQVYVYCTGILNATGASLVQVLSGVSGTNTADAADVQIGNITVIGRAIATGEDAVDVLELDGSSNANPSIENQILVYCQHKNGHAIRGRSADNNRIRVKAVRISGGTGYTIYGHGSDATHPVGFEGNKIDFLSGNGGYRQLGAGDTTDEGVSITGSAANNVVYYRDAGNGTPATVCGGASRVAELFDQAGNMSGLNIVSALLFYIGGNVDTVLARVSAGRASIGGVNVIMASDIDPAGHHAFKNRLINGGFRFNQRAATSSADDTYCMDRWYVLTQVGAVAVTRQNNPEAGAAYGIRLTQSDATPQRMGIAQIIPNSSTRDLRSALATFFGRVRRSDGGAVRYAILEWTGTADAVTSDIVNDWTSTTYTINNFFINSASLNPLVVGTVTTTAATWRDLDKVTGTLSSSANNLIVFAWCETVMATATTLDFNRFQCEPGSYATRFDQLPDGIEYHRCAYYFRKSYDADTVPGTSTQGNAIFFTSRKADQSDRITIEFGGQMRTGPTVTIFSTTGATGNWRDIVGAADLACATASVGDRRIVTYATANTTIDRIYAFHFTADAEL